MYTHVCCSYMETLHHWGNRNESCYCCMVAVRTVCLFARLFACLVDYHDNPNEKCTHMYTVVSWKLCITGVTVMSLVIVVWWQYVQFVCLLDCLLAL